jgi:ferredoxin-NADP reductase
MHVIFDHIKPETDTIDTFFFKPEQPVDYTAGQFIELHVPHAHSDDRGDKRWFTLSSSPTDDLISITTRIATKNGSSFKKALKRAKPGSEFHISDPMGDFVLPKLLQTPLVFVAGGIGVTPFHSILSWLAATKEQRPIKFIYAVQSEDEIIFQDVFDNAKQHVTVVVNEPSDAWGGEHGMITANLILGLEKPADDTLIYLAGPEPMVEKLSHELHKAGVEKRQLVTDFFPGYTAI